MLKEADSEALRAVEVHEKIRAAKDVERCRSLLRKIERASHKLDPGELLEVVQLPTPVNFPFSAHVPDTIPQVHPDSHPHESSAPIVTARISRSRPSGPLLFPLPYFPPLLKNLSAIPVDLPSPRIALCFVVVDLYPVLL